MGALQAGVDTVLMGVSRVSQVHDNIAATELHLPAEQIAALDAASLPEAAMIYGLFTPEGRRQIVFGGSAVASYQYKMIPRISASETLE
jgi:hypothetical protein